MNVQVAAPAEGHSCVSWVSECACVEFQDRRLHNSHWHLCIHTTTFSFLPVSTCYILQFMTTLPQTILFKLLLIIFALASLCVCVMFLSHLSDMCVICFVLYTYNGDLLLLAEYILCCLVSF